MKVDKHVINLDLMASERWAFLKNYIDEINELLQCYLNDFEGYEFIFDVIGQYRTNFISSEYNAEIDFIASISKFTPNEVAVANLYYDILKFYFGCTAYAVSNGTSIFHARNLDWHTDNNLLSKHTLIFDFQKSGKTIYKTVGWPGFVGVLSGTKPGKFSLTLNAILSDDQAEIAYPISFLLRDTLEQSNSFEEAKIKIEETGIACDCLILLSGNKPSEMTVIERTPKRKKIENVVQNDSLLQMTSCSRYDRTLEQLDERLPENLEDCITVLKDEKVKMNITVQQMVFDNLTGEVKVIKT